MQLQKQFSYTHSFAYFRQFTTVKNNNYTLDIMLPAKCVDVLYRVTM